MTPIPRASPSHPRLTRRLMACGLAFWGMSIGGAHAPRVLRAMFYPNDAVDAHFDLVAVVAQPVPAPVLWTGLILWCASWTFVVGYLASACAAHQGCSSWAAPALLLLSLASPLVFGFAAPALIRLASRGAYHGNGVVSPLGAVLTQLATSGFYASRGWFAGINRHRRLVGAE